MYILSFVFVLSVQVKAYCHRVKTELQYVQPATEGHYYSVVPSDVLIFTVRNYYFRQEISWLPMPNQLFTRVPTAGILDKYLLLVISCHVVGTVHLYKDWPVWPGRQTLKCT